MYSFYALKYTNLGRRPNIVAFGFEEEQWYLNIKHSATLKDTHVSSIKGNAPTLLLIEDKMLRFVKKAKEHN